MKKILFTAAALSVVALTGQSFAGDCGNSYITPRKSYSYGGYGGYGGCGSKFIPVPNYHYQRKVVVQKPPHCAYHQSAPAVQYHQPAVIQKQHVYRNQQIQIQPQQHVVTRPIQTPVQVRQQVQTIQQSPQVFRRKVVTQPQTPQVLSQVQVQSQPGFAPQILNQGSSVQRQLQLQAPQILTQPQGNPVKIQNEIQPQQAAPQLQGNPAPANQMQLQNQGQLVPQVQQQILSQQPAQNQQRFLGQIPQGF